ncbi:MAG TPA: adenylate/guanylate cyclase domain-containing protein [Actinomycetota bacterium]|nr:adenylate/guanylate cyclase domain-containing protein [Actinomycetota bacterium]
MPDDLLTEVELAERGGTTVGRIRELVDLGIVRPDNGMFRRRDVMVVRVVETLEAKGIDAGSVAVAAASGDLTLGYLESAGRRHPRSDTTYERLAVDIGIDVEMLERTYVAFGLPAPAPDEHVRSEDLEVLRMLPVLISAGVPEGEVLRLARVWGDAARKVAQYLTHYMHHAIEEQYRRRGLRDNEAFEAALAEVGLRAGRSGEDMLSWLFRRHSETFMTEHQFEHVEMALEQAGVRLRPAKTVGAIVFADLTGYTRLTEEAGDEVAAAISVKLAALVKEVAVHHDGEVVKMLGDGVCFHFRDPRDAVLASLEIVRSVGPRGLPPAHIGVNAGPVIYDEGDYFGRTVNIAARIASEAGPEEVLVGEAVLATGGSDGVSFEERGAADLKGIADPVPLYRAVTAEGLGRG